MTQTVISPAEVTDDNDDDGLIHSVCICNEDIALCGEDVTDDPWTTYEECLPEDCIVCEMMEICPKCGRELEPSVY